MVAGLSPALIFFPLRLFSCTDHLNNLGKVTKVDLLGECPGRLEMLDTHFALNFPHGEISG